MGASALSALSPMSDIAVISSLRSVADSYDALLCDAWGVIHNGVDLFPGVAEALAQFRKTRGPVIILTNAPRPSSIIPGQLDRIGLLRDCWDEIVTSGDATRAAIEARLPAPAYKLGPAKDDPLFEGLDIDFRPLDEAEFIICTGMKDDAHETPDDYREFLKEAAAKRLPMICANPDIVVNWGGRMIWCAGALAEIYKDFGCEVIYGGKPHPPIYDLALNRIESLRGPTERNRILAVGDGFKTDILGANNQKLDVIFIAGDGGVHEGARDAAAISQKLAEAGLKAIGVAEGLKW